ncbi:MAG: aminotransferase class IV [Planctomycetaceae bacterium]
MTEPIAYLNGEWVPFSAARLSVADYGVVQAATVTELIRTFRHRPFRMAEHLVRLRHSLAATGIASPILVDELPPVIERVVAENTQLVDESDDLGITVFATAGINPMYGGGSVPIQEAPTVCVHSFPLAFERWAEQYERGVTLITPSIRSIPRATIDPRIKCRSRLHWFLADREAQRSGPRAMALLLDDDWHLTETSSGNVLLYDGHLLQTPRAKCVLGGISQGVVLELAESFGITHRERNLNVSDLLEAKEVFVSSTSYCLLPVISVNGKTIGSGTPGPLFRRLIDGWSRMIEMDIVGQAQERTNSRTA